MEKGQRKIISSSQKRKFKLLINIWKDVPSYVQSEKFKLYQQRNRHIKLANLKRLTISSVGGECETVTLMNCYFGVWIAIYVLENKFNNIY